MLHARGKIWLGSLGNALRGSDPVFGFQPNRRARTGLPKGIIGHTQSEPTKYKPNKGWRCTQAAGEVHQLDEWTFQLVGEEPEVIAKSLQRLTDNGKVPEALCLAHLIGSAVMLGESSNRA